MKNKENSMKSSVEENGDKQADSDIKKNLFGNGVTKCENIKQLKPYSKLIERVNLKGEIILRAITPNTTTTSPTKSILQFVGTWQFKSALTPAMDFRYMTSSMFELDDTASLSSFKSIPKQTRWKGNFENMVHQKKIHVPENFSLEIVSETDSSSKSKTVDLEGFGRNRFGEFHLLLSWNINTSKVTGQKIYFEKLQRGALRAKSTPESSPMTLRRSSTSSTVRTARNESNIANRVRQRRQAMMSRPTRTVSRTNQLAKNKRARTTSRTRRGRPKKKAKKRGCESPNEPEEENPSELDSSKSESKKSKASGKSQSSSSTSESEDDYAPDNIFKNLSSSPRNIVSRKNRTGFAICAYPSGFMYEGQWYRGKKHGKGIVYDIRQGEPKIVFQGEFVEDCITGIGTFLSENGDRYDGELSNGNFHGYGEYFQRGSTANKREDQTYTGDWIENRRHGNGRIYLHESRSSYEGSWATDIFHGEGTLIVPNKVQYSGSFEYGVMEGKGVCHYYKAGKLVGKYEGGFKEGLRHGRGWYKFYDSNKSLIGEFEGRFKKDEMEGNNVIDVAENTPISINKDLWVLPLKRQSEMKYIHQLAGFKEDGS